MNRILARGWGSLTRPLPVAMTLAALSVPASAIEFSGENFVGHWDTTLTYGVRSRLQDRDSSIIGIANGGEAYSVNGDDGNLNFEKGIVSNSFRVTSEVEMDYDLAGFFVRGTAFYDAAVMNCECLHVDLTDEAERRQGSDGELLDAYVWGDFEIGDRAGTVRLGNQVLSWGESTFILNGINAINPINVNQLRVPGSELRDALVPIPLLWGSIDVTENGSFEAFYELKWKETIIDPPGTYFSTNDFAGEGGDRVMLGFGGAPEDDFLGVGRSTTDEARDDGQFGLAYRLFAPWAGDTEFGLFYVRYHSRVPIISGRTGTQAGVEEFDAILEDTGGTPLGTALATNAYAQTASYFTEYPEDIDLLGLSFNTQLGTSGVALQGELSYRNDVPLQVDDAEVLFGALSPINDDFANDGQLGGFGVEEDVTGFVKLDVWQLQSTATWIVPTIFGAQQMALVGEVAINYINDMPDKDDLRLETSGTYLSGNEDLNQYHGPGAGLWEPASAFADQTSWGYRIRGRLTYTNAIGALTLTPLFAWADDVKGNSAGPGANFREGRQALLIGVGGNYLNRWTGRINYVTFSGAGRYNLINDRDFIAFNLKYLF